MAKFYGRIGFIETTETPAGSGIWKEVATERNYYGDILKNTKRWENGSGSNDNLNISNQISIIADPYANNNLYAIRYVEWLGALWKITNVDVEYPRLIISIGGVYNGLTPVAPSNT